jgi:hypothetical protein
LFLFAHYLDKETVKEHNSQQLEIKSLRDKYEQPLDMNISLVRYPAIGQPTMAAVKIDNGSNDYSGVLHASAK